MTDRIETLWREIYGTDYPERFEELRALLDERSAQVDYAPEETDWYQTGVVYSMYVDLFADDFDGLVERLEYLDELGVTIVWLLPVLESPMVDQGFDVSDFTSIRDELGGNEAFLEFVDAAHDRGIKVVFDVPINHTSDQHPWFQNARQSEDAEYRDYYIWNDDTEKYQDARLLLKGVSDSNWTYNEPTDDYYFHRFYDIQPDLNYRNPDVLIDMLRILTRWRVAGVDGFRMDAAPFLWKREGTDCENLPETHAILKLFRAAFEYVADGTVMIAEANQEPADVIDYFGDGDECHVAYNFPVMPKFFLALAENDPTRLTDELAALETLDVPDDAQWFTFLRVHDELTLEFVSPDERQLLNDHYLEDERWSFRDGEGISGRLYNLLEEDPDRVRLAYSMLFAVEGTPIIYYGDEIGMENDRGFYEEMNETLGYGDSRYLHRGPFDEARKTSAVTGEDDDAHAIWSGLREMIDVRTNNPVLFRQTPTYSAENGVFVSTRVHDDRTATIYNNVTPESRTVDGVELDGYEYVWDLSDR
ncbi:alpha-amylase family glycosyl hydrolase [Halapricum desulfuricans]|uniref:Glycosidase n=1 Tax=Halapricum desulfuricans TaxID=2841257 RepID=A0A897MYF8_9EURY|nr:alpha-amylase family glycosyl hydrolase [Halapricum desulfuricans]QSG05497.1 Glycosidase [Halapricum desulfuricans]